MEDLPSGIHAQIQVEFQGLSVLLPADLRLRMAPGRLALQHDRLTRKPLRRLRHHPEIRLQI